MKTFHIHIEGIVQGVGFRPFVYQLARARGLTGWVNNGNDGVHIEITADEQSATDFAREIVDNPPVLATILGHTIKETRVKEYTSFDIISSTESSRANLPLTPDFALCEDCRTEIRKSDNRRFAYGFTTCTNCGPRYSIIQKMPYDRPNTTMDVFEQCPVCASEYNDPLDRRHYSQTNSCADCGIKMFSGSKKVDVDFIVKKLDQGKILAVKGIGGFLLIADAGNPESINTLRARKHRPAKPFAVMYPDLASIEQEFYVSDRERKLFQNEVSPIILLEPKKGQLSLHKSNVAPGLNKIGLMIPYAPVFQLILDAFKRPIIATSGNISGSPIIYTNEDAGQELTSIADYIITNDRDIVIPQDDSVVSFSGNQQIVIRRSRGLAPGFLKHNLDLPEKRVLAMGADMKSAFALTTENYLYVSQYLGDMDSYLTQAYYEKTLAHLSTVLDHQPGVLLVDRHPGYFSSNLGHNLAKEKQLPVFEIQHHKAHFYAVLSENKLLKTTEPVLGIIWDGTGYGDDGMIWGGEFFRYEPGVMTRESHLPYFPFILGDKMPREPRIGALAVGKLLDEDIPEIKKKFTETEWQLYQPMLAEPALQTSSMGRLFDAVASLVLGIDKTSYEGEAAMMLEAAASAPDPAIKHNYDFPLENFQAELLRHILEDIKTGISSGEIALKFHYSLVNLIRQEADKLQVRKLAFSGGVFQNSLLVKLILEELSSNFDLYFHNQLSPNDENISYGQIAWYTMHEKQLSHEIPV